MKRTVLIVGLVFLCLAMLAGLALALPFLKEGYSGADGGIFAGVAAAALILGIGWFAVTRSQSAGWRVPGMAMMVPPVLVHGLFLANIAFDTAAIRFLESDLNIVAVRAEPIVWAGFGGPVGVALEIDVSHRDLVNGRFEAPTIALADSLPQESIWHRSFLSVAGFLRTRNDAGLAVLRAPVFGGPQQHYLDLNGRDTFRYALYPGVVELIAAPDKVCVHGYTPGVPVCENGQTPDSGCFKAQNWRAMSVAYEYGATPKIRWRAVRKTEAAADFGPAIADKLKNSGWIGADPQSWRNLHQRLEPAGLSEAGFDICPPGRNSHSITRVCYCRSPSIPNTR